MTSAELQNNSYSRSKLNFVLVSVYPSGLFPSGDDSVLQHSLAPAILKSAISSDAGLESRYNTVIVDLPNFHSPEDVATTILQHKPDIVGFSVYIWNYDHSVKISQILRNNLAELPIIWGGPQVSYNPEEMLGKNPYVSLIICGSGETRLKRVLECGLDSSQYPAIPGIAYIDENGNFQLSPGTLPAEDLGKIPSPFASNIINLQPGKKHNVFIETFRGCPHECGFCIWGRKSRSLNYVPLEQSLADIDLIYSNDSVCFVCFCDAFIFYNRKRGEAILKRILDAPLKIPTYFELDINCLTENNIPLLGPILEHSYEFGIQSSTVSALDLMGRKADKDTFIKKLKLLRKIDTKARIWLDLIYGMPGDSYETFRDAVEFALSMAPEKVKIYPLYVLPGSPFWYQKEKLGIVHTEDPPYQVLSNNDFSSDDIRKARRFSFWVQMVGLFPAIREMIEELAVSSEEVTRVEIIEQLADIVSNKVDLLPDHENLEERLSINNYNDSKRAIMNQISEPENALALYQAALDILDRYPVQKCSKTVKTGFAIYQEMVASNTISNNDWSHEQLKSTQCTWVKPHIPA
ncbi:MAG: cobalamin-dependent protein [Magnetococcales bacterium]|nr:cobalamin-dependent protein [Magnetococcales bacterium]